MEFMKERKEIRTDLISLIAFQHSQSNKESDLDKSAIDLFWAFRKPRVMTGDTTTRFEEVGVLPDYVQEDVLETLKTLEKASRVPYEPDTEPDYGNLVVYANIAACCALLLKERDGFSEDVRDMLEEAWRALRRFGIEYMSADDQEEFSRSLCGLVSIILIELFRVRRIDGNYEEALHLFAQALSYASDTLLAAFGEEAIESWRLKYEEYIPIINVNAQEAVNGFEDLRASAKTRNWRQIAADCRMINLSWGDCLGSYQEFRSPEEVITDGEGREWQWLSFWEHARGWAEAKLEPSELLEEMKRAEDERAEERLKTYFFLGLWHYLPDRARQSLVEADRMWNSAKGRREAIVNELRLATEATLLPMLWHPFSDWIDNQPHKSLKNLRFIDMQKELAQKQHEPSLGNLIEMWKTDNFDQFLRKTFPKQEDRSFIADLFRPLIELNRERRKAEHPPSKPASQVVNVVPVFRKFIGIGCLGILPRLAQILQKIAETQRKAGASE